MKISPYVYAGITTLEVTGVVTNDDFIAQKICNEYNVSFEEIKSVEKTRRLNKPRAIIFFALNIYKKRSLVWIGKRFNRDHSSVLHAIKTLKAECQVNSEVRQELFHILNSLNQSWAMDFNKMMITTSFTPKKYSENFCSSEN